MEFLSGLFVLFAVALLYLLPTLIAYSRGHRNTAPIFATNLILGWMVIGWVIALIWSLTSNVRGEQA